VNITNMAALSEWRDVSYWPTMRHQNFRDGTLSHQSKLKFKTSNKQPNYNCKSHAS